MNLVIDIGNTLTKIGFFSADNTEPQYTTTYKNDIDCIILDENQLKSVDSAIISSVGQEDDALTHLLKSKNLIKLSNTIPLPIKINYRTPQTLGSDRVAASCGAWFMNKEKNSLVINCGTCLTFDVVTSEGIYLGGKISPGMMMRYKALHQFTAGLPLIQDPTYIQHIGTSTNESIHCGIVEGIKYEIETTIDNMNLLYSGLKVFVSGGDALFFEKTIKNRIFVDQFIVLKGLNYILNFNFGRQ